MDIWPRALVGLTSNATEILTINVNKNNETSRYSPSSRTYLKRNMNLCMQLCSINMR